MIIRAFTPRDDLEALTRMLHQAYAPLASRGLQFVATYQTAEVTAQRIADGHAFVAEIDGNIIGTLTVYPPDPESSALAYRDSRTYSFGQFGVDPAFQRRGVGRALHEAAIDYALSQGAEFMCLDTAAPATDLIVMYEGWGYTVVGRTQWKSTNYESVIMRRGIGNKPNKAPEPTSGSVTPRAIERPSK